MAKHMHTLEASSIRHESFELARVLLVLLALLLLQLLELLLSGLLLLIVLGLNTRIDCLIARSIAVYEFDILYCTVRHANIRNGTLVKVLRSLKP